MSGRKSAKATQGLKTCKNLFFKHEELKRESEPREFRQAPPALLEDFSAYLKKGDFLCSSCRATCFEIIRDQGAMKKRGVAKSIEEYVETEIAKNKKSDEASGPDKIPNEVDDAKVSNEGREGSSLNETEEEFLADIEVDDLMNAVNKLLVEFEMDTLSLEDLENNPQQVEETIDALETTLRNTVVYIPKKNN